MAITCSIINANDTSYFVIIKYIFKTNRIKTISLGPIKSFVTIEDIWSIKSGSILRILVVMKK